MTMRMPFLIVIMIKLRPLAASSVLLGPVHLPTPRPEPVEGKNPWPRSSIPRDPMQCVTHRFCTPPGNTTLAVGTCKRAEIARHMILKSKLASCTDGIIPRVLV